MAEFSPIAVFDLDGTLIDSRHDLAFAVNMTRRRFGLEELSLFKVVDSVGDGLRKLIERTTTELDGSVPIEERLRMMKNEYGSSLLNHTTLYPKVKETLLTLKTRGWLLAILSNKPDDWTREILNGLGVADLFDYIRGASEGLPLKPDPKAIEMVVGRFLGKTDYSIAWMIGDNHTDIEVARRAGIRSCHAAYGFGKLCGEVPTIAVSTFSELEKVLVWPQN